MPQHQQEEGTAGDSKRSTCPLPTSKRFNPVHLRLTRVTTSRVVRPVMCTSASPRLDVGPSRSQGAHRYTPRGRWASAHRIAKGRLRRSTPVAAGPKQAGRGQLPVVDQRAFMRSHRLGYALDAPPAGATSTPAGVGFAGASQFVWWLVGTCPCWLSGMVTRSKSATSLLPARTRAQVGTCQG